MTPVCPAAAQVEALQAAVSDAVDSQLPRDTLKTVLEAAVDPKRRPDSAAARVAVDAVVDAGGSPAAVKAVANAGILLAHQDIGCVLVRGAADAAGSVFQASALM
jgi:hypothetical protein